MILVQIWRDIVNFIFLMSNVKTSRLECYELNLNLALLSFLLLNLQLDMCTVISNVVTTKNCFDEDNILIPVNNNKMSWILDPDYRTNFRGILSISLSHSHTYYFWSLEKVWHFCTTRLYFAWYYCMLILSIEIQDLNSESQLLHI